MNDDLLQSSICRRDLKRAMMELDHLRGENDALYREVIALRESLSWRITAPLRLIHSFLTGSGVHSDRQPTPPPAISKPLPKRMESEEVMVGGRHLLQLKLSLFLSIPDARIRLQRHEAPLVSVIIVLFNKAEYTFQSLESLAFSADLPHEVIVIDNCSTDDTRALLRRVDNVRVVLNAENEGFLRACNRGVEEARGEWLLFLNNDTQVVPGFLSRMVECARREERCGAVGAKLVHPNGTLQEAGSIIWRDGSCSAYGRGGDPDAPEFNFVREVDYCSGACLLVNRSLFLDAGKFDERYAPAYYEETDLCMELRRRGYRVMYQPTATVIHYEFGSATSRDSSLGLQTVNRRKFREKWKEVLDSSHHEPSEQSLLTARERLPAGMRRILIVDDCIPDPALGSGNPRAFYLLSCLVGLGWNVTFYPLQEEANNPPVTALLGQMGIEVMHGWGRHGFAPFISERRSRYDLVWVSRPHNMHDSIGIIRGYAPQIPLIYDGEALFAQRDVLKARIEGVPFDEDEAHTLIETELSLIAQADAVVAVSPQELATMCKKLDHSLPRVVLGHALDVEPTAAGFDERRDILFVGGILTEPSPNQDAVRYFVEEVLPLVRERLDVRVWIVGTVLVDSVKNLASDTVIITGRVDDLRPYYESCRVFIVPTRYAAGIPYKLHEALAHGVPAVVTPLIAGQLSLDESTVLIGGDPQEFADKVVSCYTDAALWQSLRSRGIEFVRDECSPPAYRERLEQFLQQVLERT